MGDKQPLPGASGLGPPGHHQSGPVDLATKPPGSLGPIVAQIRIPTVTSIRPGGLQGGLQANLQGGLQGGIQGSLQGSIQGSLQGGLQGSLQGGPRAPGKIVVPIAAPQGASKVTVLPAPFSTRGPSPGVRATLATRPILAQPAPSRPTSGHQGLLPRAAMATPILRAMGPGGQGGHTALTLRAPLPQSLAGSIRLAPPSVQWVQTSAPGQQGHPRPLTARPPTVLPVGTRVSMAAVSFRPAGPIMSTPRPALISPTAGGVTLVQTGTKTIVTQNPAGIFKPITTQVSATGQNTVKAAPVPVRVPIGQRVSVVSGTPLAVSLTPANPGHIQVPLVPGALGPQISGGKRVAVTGPGIGKLVAEVMGAQGPRTISLPYSGQPAKPGAPTAGSIPVARVVPQPSLGRHDHSQVPQGFVVSSAGSPAVYVPAPNVSQPSPVNLTVSDRSAFSTRAPAMTMPSFAQTNLFYESTQQNSVTITTLPKDTVLAPSHGPATITPARITPIAPGQQGGAEGERQLVPGSPRPSILRKRPEGEPAGVQIKGTALLQDSPPRPESSGSSTISAISSEMVDEAGAGVAVLPAPSLEPSPRKKPRKQQLPPRETATNISPEWAAVKRELGARDRMEWNRGPEPDWPDKVRNWNSWPEAQGQGAWGEADHADGEADGEVSSEEEPEKPGNFIQGKPRMSLVRSYRHTWKSRANHFLRYTDVRSKDERRPTVNELANQKYVLQKINGWKIYHLGAGMEDIVDMESELSKRLQEVGRRLEEAAHGEVGKELGKVQELIKANIQRSKVIQDQVKEAKDTCQSIFEHKPKIQEIILKYQSKRSLKRRRD